MITIQRHLHRDEQHSWNGGRKTGCLTYQRNPRRHLDVAHVASRTRDAKHLPVATQVQFGHIARPPTSPRKSFIKLILMSVLQVILGGCVVLLGLTGNHTNLSQTNAFVSARGISKPSLGKPQHASYRDNVVSLSL